MALKKWFHITTSWELRKPASRPRRAIWRTIWGQKDSSELHQCRPGANAFRPWNSRFHYHAQTLPGTCAPQTKLRPGRAWAHRGLSGKRRCIRDYWPGHIRRLRISDHGDVEI